MCALIVLIHDWTTIKLVSESCFVSGVKPDDLKAPSIVFRIDPNKCLPHQKVAVSDSDSATASDKLADCCLCQ